MPVDDTQQQGGEGGAPRPSRPVNLVALAGAVILIGLVAFAAYRRGDQAGPPPPEAAAAPPAESTGPEQGTVITAQVPVHLTPEASIIAERYRCICGCNDPLNVCTCSNTPGSRDMKMYVQELVNEAKSVKEIDERMVGRYGQAVLLSVPAPSPSPAPAGQRSPQRSLRRSNSK
jgi:hypothetical protein